MENWTWGLSLIALTVGFHVSGVVFMALVLHSIGVRVESQSLGLRRLINFRSEGRRFPVGRCLIPASHFFEFTGAKSPKTKWKFTKAGEDWFCFAGLWRPMAAGGEAFTLLATEPSADVAPIHDRQMVVLARSDWSAWLEQTGNEADLLKALPAGSLRVEQVR